MEQKYIAALDLGTSKIALAIALVSGSNVEVIYYNETPSDGIRRSTVINPMKASIPIRNLICDAEAQLKLRIRQVVLGLPRFSVSQEIAQGKLERSNPNEYISREEIEALKDIALQQYPLDDPATQVIYGAVAQSFSTDDEIGLTENDVIGSLSASVTGNFKVFVGVRSSINAIDKMFNDLGIAIARKYFIPDVTAKAVLNEEEKENGVALVDFGAGVTSISIYSKGIMRHYSSIPFGGDNVTRDIRIVSSISDSLAENIKHAYGACLPSKLANLSEKILQIRYEDAPFKEIPVKYLSMIIDAREREIVEAILYTIQESHLQEELRSGIVITGGGANMANLCNLIKDMSGYYVRIGYPKHRFSAGDMEGVFETGAVGAIGMLLASRDDRLPGCLTAPATIPIPFYNQPSQPEPAAAAAVEPQSEPEQKFEQEPQQQPDPVWSEPVSTVSIPAEPEPEPAPQEEAPAPVVETPAAPQEARRPAEPPRKNTWGRMVWTKLSKMGSNVGEFLSNSVDKFYESVTEEVE